MVPFPFHPGERFERRGPVPLRAPMPGSPTPGHLQDVTYATEALIDAIQGRLAANEVRADLMCNPRARTPRPTPPTALLARARAPTPTEAFDGRCN